MTFEEWLQIQRKDPHFSHNYHLTQRNLCCFFVGQCLSCEEIEVFFYIKSITTHNHKCGKCASPLAEVDPGDIEWDL